MGVGVQQRGRHDTVCGAKCKQHRVGARPPRTSDPDPGHCTHHPVCRRGLAEVMEFKDLKMGRWPWVSWVGPR